MKKRFELFIDDIVDLEEIIITYFGDGWKYFFKQKYKKLFLIGNSLLAFYEIFLKDLFKIEDIEYIFNTLFKYSDLKVFEEKKGFRIEFYKDPKVHYI